MTGGDKTLSAKILVKAAAVVTMKRLLALVAAALALALCGCWGTGSSGGSSGSSGASSSCGSSGATNPTIAVIGDSYAAGEGSGGRDDICYIRPTNDGAFINGGSTTTQDNCHRSSNAYAETIFHAGVFVACSGANYAAITTRMKLGDTYTTFRSDGPKTQVMRLNTDVKTVIVGLGGDDANFAGVLTACTNSFEVVTITFQAASGAGCQPEINQVEKGFYTGKGNIESNLITLYEDILSPGTVAPDAHIYAIGYPNIFPPHGYTGDCSGITASNQNALNLATDSLNTVIRQAAAKVSSETGKQVTFVDTTNVMQNHWVCGSPPGNSGWINDLQIATPTINPGAGHHATRPGAAGNPTTGSGSVSVDDFSGSGSDCLPRDITSYGKNIGLFGAQIGVLGVCSQSYHPTADGSHAIGEKILMCMKQPSTCGGPNPPLDAVAAWNATDNECASTVGASLRHVASILPSSDTTQVAELDQLATLPLSELGSQAQEGQADVTALNEFFGTDRALTSFTGPCPSPSQSAAPAPSPGNDSPADAVDGFYQGELDGNWGAANVPGTSPGACSYVIPSFQSLCQAGTAGQGEATGQFTVGQAEISGSEALVPVTGSICAPSSPCVENDDAGLGMPLSPEQFPADYQEAVDNSLNGSSTSMSPVPCSQVDGEWYVDLG
jgi:hypothetical protein